MIREHQRIVLTVPVPAEKLEVGDVGTVVHIYRDGQAFEVEFMTLDGETLAVVSFHEHQVRPVDQRELAQARSMPWRRIPQARL